MVSRQHMNRLFALVAILATCFQSIAQYPSLNWVWVGDSSNVSSIRGLMLDRHDSTVWMSGSKGLFGKWSVGNKVFEYRVAKGFEQYDFRDVYAFNQRHALLMSSGNPTVVIATEDGGETWQQVFFSSDKNIFLDAFEFLDNGYGLCIGDPIDQSFLLLQSNDHGQSWKKDMGPPADPNEAAFAASGTCFRFLSSHYVVAVTGGASSHLIIGSKDGDFWQLISLDSMVHGMDSRGCYALDVMETASKWMVCGVGGDYKEPRRYSWPPDSGRTNAFTCEVLLHHDTIPLNKKWFELRYATIAPPGYCSAVRFLSPRHLVACGTEGVYFSSDSGKSWEQISQQGFNAIEKITATEVIFTSSPKNTFRVDLSPLMKP